MRLIDADKARKIACDRYIKYPSLYNHTNYALFILHQTPTIEAEPVKWGRWVMLKYPLVECSACKEMRDCSHQFGWNYCPNFGAKMESDGECE